jgi:MscS family membrane protein
VLLQTFGFSVAGVLAFGGVGGIAIGFAAKDLLANFFGGLMIYLDRPFNVGDWIRSPDKDIEGVVESIGWRLTCIRRFDKRPLYVPNSVFNHIAVENPSRMTHRRIYETIGLRYDDAAQMNEITSAIQHMLETHEAIDQDLIIMVNFDEFASSSLDFFIYAYTKTTDWATYHQVKHDVLLKAYNLIRDRGADVAFPTSTLHFADTEQLDKKQGKAQL